MRLRRLTLTAFTWLFAVSFTGGQELPHMEFVRALRARQYPDLALEYLLKLKQSGKSDNFPTLLLELAATRLDLAGQETEINRRLSILGQARAELDEFIRKYPNDSKVADAELNLARLAALQGRTQLSKALRLSRAEQSGETLAARQALEDAERRLKAAEKKLNDPAALAQLKLDQGLNLFDQAETYLDTGATDDLEKRAAIIKRAMAVLDALAKSDDKTAIAWTAKAWVGHGYSESGDPSGAEKKLQEVIDSRLKEAEHGQRLARYFLMQVTRPSGGARDDLREARITAGLAWLREYPRAKDTPEGFGVRYEIAKADVELGLDPKYKPAQRNHFERARALCKELEKVDNDFVDKARQLLIAIVKAEGGFTRDIKSLNTFEDCLVRARYEASLLAKETDKDARSKGVEKVVAVLERALSVNATAPIKAPQLELGQAQAMLTGYYLYSGQHDKVIKLGEPVARSKPANSQTGIVAMYVLEARSEKLLKHLRANDPAEDWAQDKKEFQDLAQYAEQTWPQEGPGNYARHQVGRIWLLEKKYPEAVEALSRVTPDYQGIVFARFLLADAAMRVEGPQKEAFAAKARQALETMPELPVGADKATTEVYLQAKYRLGLILLNAKKYDELDQRIDPVIGRLGQLHFENDERRKVHFNNLAMLKHYELSARAGAEYNAGNYAKARGLLDPLVDNIGADKTPELKQDPRLARTLVSLALSANLQDNQLERAQKILQVMRKTLPEEDKDESNAIILRQVAQLVQDLVRTAKAKSNPDELEKALGGYFLFVEKLKEEYSKDATLETKRLLAACYAGLERHDKAIELLKVMEEPKAGDARQEQYYRAARVLLMREYRLANDLSQAEKLLKEIQATPWGRTNLDVMKESYHQLEAQGKYAQAAQKWITLVDKQLLPKVNVDPQMKAQYFECYYYLTNALYQAGMKARDDKLVKRSADLIARLEQKWPDLGGEAAKSRFDSLLAGDPNLKKHYDDAKVRLAEEAKRASK